MAGAGSRRTPGMISETASGIGNPVYSMYGADEGGAKAAMDDVSCTRHINICCISTAGHVSG